MKLRDALSSTGQPGIRRAQFRQFVPSIIFAAVVAYITFFGYISITRTYDFSDPDTMNFVDIARNINNGRGITQSALGFNEPRFSLYARPPEPLTAQPPLYPISIALVSALGFAQADSALFLSTLCYGLILFVGYLLTKDYYDHHVALLSVTALLCYAPLHLVSKTAFSEPLGIFWILLCLWSIQRIRKTPQGFMWSLAAGLAGGLAFATRYALLWLAPLAIAFLVYESQNRLRDVGLFCLGYAASAVPVVYRNLQWMGTPLPSPNPSNVGWTQNVINTFWAVFGGYLESISPESQVIAFIVLVVIFCLILVKRQTFFDTVADVFFRDGRYVLTTWSLGYLIFLIYQRTYTHFDDIDRRLVAPAGVILMILFAALVARVVKLKAEAIYGIMLLVLLFLTTIEMRVLIRTPEYDLQDHIRASQRLSWAAEYMSDRDLIIGNDIVDIPFYLRRPSAVSFSPYPYTDYLTYDTLTRYTQIHCHEYEHIYLLLRNDLRTQEDRQRVFGPLVSDLMAGKTGKYPGILSSRQLQDGYVFTIGCK